MKQSHKADIIIHNRDRDLRVIEFSLKSKKEIKVFADIIIILSDEINEE